MTTNAELSIPSIIDAGCDYLRLSVKPGQSLHPVYERFESLIKEAENHGHERESARFLDYKGHKCGGFQVLSREDGFLFEAQGAVANRACEVLKGVEFHGNVPRCDTQATIYGTPENCPQPERVFDALRELGEQSKAFSGVNLSLERPAKTGHTCGIGSRNSGSYIRVYDAGAVHPERYPATAIRWELEGKNEVAREMYSQIQSAASLPCVATSLVMGRLMAWDIHQAWFTSQPPIYPLSTYKPTKDEQSLNWIAKYVAETIRRLIKKGYAEQLCEILGVESLVLKPQLNGNAFLSPLSSGAYNIGVMSGSEPKTPKPKKIGLMRPTHSQAAERKKLKKGGIS